MWRIILILVGLNHSVFCQDDNGSKVVCYVRAESLEGERGSWLRTSDSPLVPCTHIIFSYTKLEPADSSSLLVNSSHANGLKSLVEWRNTRQPELKIMFQLGSEEDVFLYSEMTSTPLSRRKLIQNIVDFCHEYDLDGVDLHWTYPQRKDPPEKHNYVSLAQEIRKQFQEELRCKTLSMVIPQVRDLIVPGFNLLFLNAVVDFFSLLAYNFAPGASQSSYHHSPLTLPVDADIKDRSLTAMMRLYLRIGAVAQKLVLGVPLFGNMYDANQQKILEEEIPVNEICHMEANHGWNKAGETIFGPQLKNDFVSISYDDVNSVEEKVNLINMFRLGGVMFWTMDMDDWNATCPVPGISDIGNGRNWPLISVGNQTLKREISSGLKSGFDTGSEEKPSIFSINGNNNNSNFVPSVGYAAAAPAPASYYPPSTSFGSPQNPPQAGFGGGGFPPNSFSPYNSPQSFFYESSPGIKRVEAGQDIIIEDFQIQINDNNFYSRHHNSSSGT